METISGGTKRHRTIKNSEGLGLESIDNRGAISPSVTTLVPAETESLEYDQIVNLIGARCSRNVELPGDLVVEILCKLPVKSLVRFKSVCKSWRLLINSPVFINIHLHRKNPQVGLYSNPREDTFFPVKINLIVGACNGIICFKTFDPQRRLILFNPSTREFSFLPPFEGWYYGFYYLSKTQEYQIISYSFWRGYYNSRADMTTMVLGDNHSVRTVKGMKLPGWRTDFRHVTSGTTLFWLGLKYDGRGVYKGSDIVICYDLIEQKFSRMDVPPSPPSSELSRLLDVRDDDSVIMFVTPKSTPRFFDMWILSKDKSWMKYRKIGPLETSVIMMEPIGVCWWNDNRVLCYRSDWEKEPKWDYNFFYYDLQLDQIEECEVEDDDQLTEKKMKSRYEVSYVESLVSIHGLVSRIDTKGSTKL